jgi:hypothetical protein
VIFLSAIHPARRAAVLKDSTASPRSARHSKHREPRPST